MILKCVIKTQGEVKKMKKILGLLSFSLMVGALAFFATNLPIASATVDQGWSTCQSTGPQCGTDNGTQNKTVTTDFVGICPTGYHYQNSGNYNQRCHRTLSCGFYHAIHQNCPVEHVTPTGTTCPEGYIKHNSGSETTCTKVITRT